MRCLADAARSARLWPALHGRGLSLQPVCGTRVASASDRPACVRASTQVRAFSGSQTSRIICICRYAHHPTRSPCSTASPLPQPAELLRSAEPTVTSTLSGTHCCQHMRAAAQRHARPAHSFEPLSRTDALRQATNADLWPGAQRTPRRNRSSHQSHQSQREYLSHDTFEHKVLTPLAVQIVCTTNTVMHAASAGRGQRPATAFAQPAPVLAS